MQAISANVSVAAPAAGNVRNGKTAPAQATVATKVETPQPQQAPGTMTESLSPEQVKQAIAAANEALKAVSSSLEFSQDPSTGKMVARIIDATTQQVIRQFPSEEMLAITRAIDRMQGWLLKEKA